jgi:hypothetical protein
LLVGAEHEITITTLLIKLSELKVLSAFSYDEWLRLRWAFWAFWIVHWTRRFLGNFHHSFQRQ